MGKSLYSSHNNIFLMMLRRQREAERVRQSDLAERLGWGQGTVSKVERGERRLDVIELRDWMLALGVDFERFVSALEVELVAARTNDPRLMRRQRADGIESNLTPAPGRRSSRKNSD